MQNKKGRNVKWFFLPVTQGPEASPSEEENDQDSIENDANEKGEANDDFQEHKNKKITIKTIMRNNQSFYRQDSQIHCWFWNTEHFNMYKTVLNENIRILTMHKCHSRSSVTKQTKAS